MIDTTGGAPSCRPPHDVRWLVARRLLQLATALYSAGEPKPLVLLAGDRPNLLLDLAADVATVVDAELLEALRLDTRVLLSFHRSDVMTDKVLDTQAAAERLEIDPGTLASLEATGRLTPALILRS